MSPAADKRPALIHPAALLALGGVVVAVLALLFPGLDFGRPRLRAPADELSLADLKQVLRSRPHDHAARLLLARQELTLGKWDDAERTLEPVLDESPSETTAHAARQLRLDLAKARLFALDAHD